MDVGEHAGLSCGTSMLCRRLKALLGSVESSSWTYCGVDSWWRSAVLALLRRGCLRASRSLIFVVRGHLCHIPHVPTRHHNQSTNSTTHFLRGAEAMAVIPKHRPTLSPRQQGEKKHSRSKPLQLSGRKHLPKPRAWTSTPGAAGGEAGTARWSPLPLPQEPTATRTRTPPRRTTAPPQT